MDEYITKIKGSYISGNNFGPNGTIININEPKSDIEVFEEIGEKKLVQLKKESKEYKVLEEAIQYAKEKDENKLSNFLKKHSVEFWRDVFSSLTTSGILVILERLMR